MFLLTSEREKETLMQETLLGCFLASQRYPDWRSNLQPRHVPGIKTATFLAYGTKLNQLSNPARAVEVFNKEIMSPLLGVFKC